MKAIIVVDMASYTAYMNMAFSCPALKAYITRDPGGLSMSY